MNEIQRRAVSAGFLHALQSSQELYDEWIALPKDDDAAIGGLVARTLNMAEPPDRDDLYAMARYVDANLQSSVDALQRANPNAPRHVGFMYAMQQNS